MHFHNGEFPLTIFESREIFFMTRFYNWLYSTQIHGLLPCLESSHIQDNLDPTSLGQMYNVHFLPPQGLGEKKTKINGNK